MRNQFFAVWPRAASGVHAHRVMFVDVTRALAVVLMIGGHTVSALLALDYQSGPWFARWQFQRGLTSSVFLLLSGFAFSIATSRHWTAHLRVAAPFVKRLRRFGLLVVLGYALHLPVGHFWQLPGASAEQWRTFLAVDVLQLIGTMLVLAQVLVIVCRSRRNLAVVAFVIGTALIALTPVMWNTPWTAIVPLSVAGYLSPEFGSLFPLFPFGASLFFGICLGEVYSRWGASHLDLFANRVLLGGGGALVALALTAPMTGLSRIGTGPGATIPAEFILRTGVSFLVLGGVAHVCRYISHMSHVVGALAQESLVIYVLHLCIVYGSVWNVGLAQMIGPRLSPLQTLPIALTLIVAMTLVSSAWNACKHSRPRTARWVMAVVGVTLVVRLI